MPRTVFPTVNPTTAYLSSSTRASSSHSSYSPPSLSPHRRPPPSTPSIQPPSSSQSHIPVSTPSLSPPSRRNRIASHGIKIVPIKTRRQKTTRTHFSVSSDMLFSPTTTTCLSPSHFGIRVIKIARTNVAFVRAT
ncbi:hypothetical protein SISSUDRAFT_1067315 [Sistotremastrum suecicum HHB10207 ss-3]|uniref:Uncharacterized protein n=1 Tax=Sistotremastrum suecicum HHB10207 ss-3 TaxID=1314776 RepID=A0A165X912_9AGAM|nr:hypothetical protein SISSUDRAFT_1067315 [Sistotremastrum suecicum HHB10207 ss-3]